MNPTKVSALELRTIGDEVLVHDPTHEQVHVLNGIAGRILELCDGSRSAEAIARDVSSATGADFARVNADVEAILAQFATLKLLG